MLKLYCTRTMVRKCPWVEIDWWDVLQINLSNKCDLSLVLEVCQYEILTKFYTLKPPQINLKKVLTKLTKKLKTVQRHYKPISNGSLKRKCTVCRSQILPVLETGGGARSTQLRWGGRRLAVPNLFCSLAALFSGWTVFKAVKVHNWGHTCGFHFLFRLALHFT